MESYFIIFQMKNVDYPQIELKYIIFSFWLRINDILEMIDIVAHHNYRHYIVKKMAGDKEPCIPFLFYDSLLHILRS